MSLPSRRTLIFAALIALLVAARVRSEPRLRADDVDRQVRIVLATQVERWNAGALERFAATYWKSPELVFQSGGDRNVGWDAMLARYRKQYQADGKSMGRLTFRNLEVKPVGPEAAYAYGRWELTMPDGTTPSGLFTVIVKRLPEGWRIVHDHTSTSP